MFSFSYVANLPIINGDIPSKIIITLFSMPDMNIENTKAHKIYISKTPAIAETKDEIAGVRFCLAKLSLYINNNKTRIVDIITKNSFNIQTAPLVSQYLCEIL